jgi:hypothetical protein
MVRQSGDWPQTGLESSKPTSRSVGIWSGLNFRFALHATIRTLLSSVRLGSRKLGLLARVLDRYHGVGGVCYAYTRGTAYGQSVCLSRSGRHLSRDASESHHWNQDTTWLWAKDFFFGRGAAQRAASARDIHLFVISNARWQLNLMDRFPRADSQKASFANLSIRTSHSLGIAFGNSAASAGRLRPVSGRIKVNSWRRWLKSFELWS